MPILRLAAVVLLALASAASTACARTACLPQVHDGWLRLPPVSMPMLAGFGRIRNECDSAIDIVRAESDAFGDVSLHETRIVDGISRMRAVPVLSVAKGQDATLAPGGLHLMLMQPRGALKPGDAVTIRFVLRDGRHVEGRFVVRPAAG